MVCSSCNLLAFLLNAIFLKLFKPAQQWFSISLCLEQKLPPQSWQDPIMRNEALLQLAKLHFLLLLEDFFFLVIVWVTVPSATDFGLVAFACCCKGCWSSCCCCWSFGKSVMLLLVAEPSRLPLTVATLSRLLEALVGSPATDETVSTSVRLLGLLSCWGILLPMMIKSLSIMP